MRGIQPRGGAYRARFTYRGRPYSATLPSPTAAAAWIAQQRDRLKRGEAVSVPEPPRLSARPAEQRSRPHSVEDAARALVKGALAGTARTRDGARYKPSTVRKYEMVLRVYVVPRIGALPIGSLERGDVQRLVDELAAAESAETARKALVALRVAYRLAERDGLTRGADPCKGVRSPRGDKERPARFLSPAESEQLIAAADKLDQRQERSLAGPLLRLALTAGLRLGELLACSGQRSILMPVGSVFSVRLIARRARAASPSTSTRNRRAAAARSHSRAQPSRRSAATCSPRAGPARTRSSSPGPMAGRSNHQ